MAHVWFITGSSRGFGRSLTLAALEAGDAVAATARRPEQLADLVAKYGDRVRAIALDVTDPEAAKTAIDAAVAHFGRIDTVVNNAGYANIGAVESAPEADFRAQFEANFWGVYHVSKAAVPVMRQQGGGTIVQFSSIGGRVGGAPGLAAYQAAKFAVDGLTRSLATETAPFGIRFLVVEPSGFATDWAGSSMEVQSVPTEYEPTVGAFGTMLRNMESAGDPNRAAQIIISVAKRQTMPSHLLLGVHAAHAAIAYSESQLAEARLWNKVSASADFGQPFPAEQPIDAPAR